MTTTLEKVATTYDPIAFGEPTSNWLGMRPKGETKTARRIAWHSHTAKRKQKAFEHARAAIQALIDDAKFESYPSHPKAWLITILDEQKETA